MFNKIFSNFKISAINKREQEEEFYELVAKEIEEGKQRKGLWAKALAESNFKDNKAKSLYLKMRVQSLIDEHNKNNTELKTHIPNHPKKPTETIAPELSKTEAKINSVKCNNCGKTHSSKNLRPSFLSFILYSKITRVIFWVYIGNLIAQIPGFIFFNRYFEFYPISFLMRPFLDLVFYSTSYLPYTLIYILSFLIALFGYYRAFLAIKFTHRKLLLEFSCVECGEKIQL